VTDLEVENDELRRQIAEAEAREAELARHAAEAEARPVRGPKSADGGVASSSRPTWFDGRSESERVNDSMREAIADKRHRRAWRRLWNDKPELQPEDS
jgi:cell division septum initiation protein DivIVA